MKTSSIIVPALSLLFLSAASAADPKALNAPLADAMTLLSLFEGHPALSSPVDDIKSVVLQHIANITAVVTEEYLKEFVASSMAIFGKNETNHDMNKQHRSEHTATNHVLEQEKTGSTPSSSALASQTETADHMHGEVQTSGPLPPSWLSLSGETLASAVCVNCDCNHAKGCCIIACAHQSKLRVNQELSIGSPATTETRQPQAVLSKVGTDRGPARIPEGPLTSGVTGKPEKDAGSATLKTSTGDLLKVEAGVDLDLYASYASDSLVEKLGLSTQVQPLTGNTESTIVIDGQACDILGTVPIIVEAYTEQNWTFQDLFYVLGAGSESLGKAPPELIFGIDHIRQVKGLVLKPELFA